MKIQDYAKIQIDYYTCNPHYVYVLLSIAAKPNSDLHSKAPEGCGPTDRKVCRGVADDGKPHLPADVVAQSQ